MVFGVAAGNRVRGILDSVAGMWVREGRGSRERVVGSGSGFEMWQSWLRGWFRIWDWDRNGNGNGNGSGSGSGSGVVGS
jgi:hypothetical protein